MSFATILYHADDGIAEIRLNRPQRMNAVIQALYDELSEALDRAEADDDVRAILLTGEGRAFCAGADLKAHKAGRTPFDRRQYLHGEQALCRQLRMLDKPVVAAVNGYAIGAGAELAIASDFIVMAASAEIGLPEVTIGNFVGGGVTWLLPRLVGLAKARELICLGERIGAEEALSIRLANRVFADAEFIDDARAFAARLATQAPLSMRLAKEHLNRSAEASFESMLASELEGMTFCATTRDWQEGVDAFSEKRRPRFTGE